MNLIILVQIHHIISFLLRYQRNLNPLVLILILEMEPL